MWTGDQQTLQDTVMSSWWPWKLSSSSPVMQNQAIHFCLLLVLMPRRSVACWLQRNPSVYLILIYPTRIFFARLHYPYPIRPSDRTHYLEVYVSRSLVKCEWQRQRLTDSDWQPKLAGWSGLGSLKGQTVVQRSLMVLLYKGSLVKLNGKTWKMEAKWVMVG